MVEKDAKMNNKIDTVIKEDYKYGLIGRGMINIEAILVPAIAILMGGGTIIPNLLQTVDTRIITSIQVVSILLAVCWLSSQLAGIIIPRRSDKRCWKEYGTKILEEARTLSPKEYAELLVSDYHLNTSVMERLIVDYMRNHDIKDVQIFLDIVATKKLNAYQNDDYNKDDQNWYDKRIIPEYRNILDEAKGITVDGDSLTEEEVVEGLKNGTLKVEKIS